MNSNISPFPEGLYSVPTFGAEQESAELETRNNYEMTNREDHQHLKPVAPRRKMES